MGNVCKGKNRINEPKVATKKRKIKLYSGQFSLFGIIQKILRTQRQIKDTII